ncbi:signal peptide peptidase SppA [Sphingomonas sp.]
MKLVRGAWKLLVGIKDALVLLAMLLFFGLLFAALAARPSAAVRDGALVLNLAGTVVEQPREIDPFTTIAGGEVAREHRLRDLIRALDLAAGDARVKAVVLDLDGFMGGYPAAMSQLGEAVGRVRAAEKPVLAYATAYTDDSYAIAANASEVWVDPMGGALFTGPGGSRLYYKGLIDRLGVTANVYRVGEFKAAVEPFTRADQSPEARAADTALYGALFQTWRDKVSKARPKAQLDRVLSAPGEMVRASGGDLAQAGLAAGLVDKLGDRTAFGKRVAEIAGAEARKPAGSYRSIALANWLAAHPEPKGGNAIGVITVAGEIVDGKGGPGSAAGDTISELILKGLAENSLKALVVRVDSPGGSVLASEKIRQAILEAKGRGLPIVVSMGSLAASGGYWVSTPGDIIFAEPDTITGSIGVFGVLPTFENAITKIGITADGVQTTPLSGQPDFFRGTNDQIDMIAQSSVENIYRRFVALVSQSRRIAPQRVDQIAQGRVWDGGTARQLGLVDRFGSLPDAIAEAARRANLDPAAVRPVYLERKPNFAARLAQGFATPSDDGAEDVRARGDLMARLAVERQAVFAQALGDARRLASAQSIQARCIECAGAGPASPAPDDRRIARWLVERILP